MSETITIGAVGDLILDRPGPMEKYFADTLEILRNTDVLIGQVETPHTDRPMNMGTYIQAPPSPPENLAVLKTCGFDIATLAGNHAFDCGPTGVQDTIDKLEKLGIAHCGTGMNISRAKEPAFIECRGIRIGVIAYNCAGPSSGNAMSAKAGNNYIKVLTAREALSDDAGAAVIEWTFVHPDSLEMLKREVAELRAACDIPIVHFHKGFGGQNLNLAYYETPLCRAAIDAGAEIVLSEHQHKLKGIDVYKKKPIFHGLGNFVTVTYAMTPGMNDSPEMIRYMKIREAMGRGKPVFDPPYYPWMEDSLDTMIVRITVDKQGVREIGFVPCRIDREAVVRLKSRENGGQEIVDRIAALSEDAGFHVAFSWNEDGTLVFVSDGEQQDPELK